MKARADDRRLFNEQIAVNVASIQESKGLNLDELGRSLAAYGVERAHLKALLECFEHAKTFGSLIQIPATLKEQLEEMNANLRQAQRNGDLYAQLAAKDLLPLVWQALLLRMQFDAVVANPPYMGGKGMTPALKDFARATFPDSRSDLFAVFIERGFYWCKRFGFHSMVTMQSWMFLSSYAAMREKLLQQRTLSSMVHMGNGVMGIAFGTAATVMLNKHVSDYAGHFSYCENEDIGENERPKSFPVQNERLMIAKPDNFSKIPGSPVAYWVSQIIANIFANSRQLKEISIPRQGNTTTNNARFVRSWYEVDYGKIGFGFNSAKSFVDDGRKWCPYNKGGGSTKWYGLNESLVDWEKDGARIKAIPHSVVANSTEYFRPGITFSTVSSSGFGFRSFDAGFIFDNKGASIFVDGDQRHYLIALLNSVIFSATIHKISPTVSLQPGDVARMPVIDGSPAQREHIVGNASQAIRISKEDWDSCEESWGFRTQPLIAYRSNRSTLADSWNYWSDSCKERVAKLRRLEEENNGHFIDIYGLQDELTQEIPEEQITLIRANRDKDSQRLISYAIGCMMGRYGLDDPGLIYAQASNIGFNPSRYARFPADADGILPITEQSWFAGDASARVREFLHVVWGGDTLEENMAWLAESLGTKGSETSDETIRRYLADKFYKDHLQTYKKRPIYWLFCSGKQGAFQALVYLHRYNEGTLARMRAEYVVPLIAKLVSRLEMLDKDMAAALSAAARTKLQRQIESLRKKQIELLAYDEKLRHYADMRITLDLDDGVKLNYAKFGDLVAESKAITGGSDE